MEKIITIEKEKFWILVITLTFLITIVLVSAAVPSKSHSSNQVEGTIPNGFCIFKYVASECPTGFSKRNILEDKTLRMTTQPSLIGTPGEGVHTHTFRVTWTEIEGDVDVKGGELADEIRIEGTSTAGELSFSHDGSTIRTVSNWPNYGQILVCCKDMGGVE